MSMYPDYIKEREGLSILETPAGFCTYKINETECFIQDIYIKPESRGDHLASAMAKEVELFAKLSDCKILTGQSDIEANNPELEIIAMLRYGFKIHGILDNKIIQFYKEI